MKLTDEDHQKLRTKQVANVIRKLNAGKTLTAREEAILAQERGVGEEVQTPGKLTASGGYAKNWDELAKALGVNRKSLGNWRTRPDLVGKLPEPRADGRHEVAAWLRAMVTHGLANADEDIGEEDDASFPGGSVRDWKKRREQLLCFKLERVIAREDETLLVAGELEVAVGQLLAGLQTALSQMPGAAARFLVGLRDVHEVQDRLQTEIDTVLSQLSLALYLDDCLEETVRALPNDSEAAAKLKLVLFDEKDLPTFLDLIQWASREVLSRIGRKALGNLTQGQSENSSNPNEQQTKAGDKQNTDHPSQPSAPVSTEIGASKRASTSSKCRQNAASPSPKSVKRSHKSKKEQLARAKRKAQKLAGKAPTPAPSAAQLGLDPAAPRKSTRKRR